MTDPSELMAQAESYAKTDVANRGPRHAEVAPTNPSETRDSELALNLRADASLLADMFSGKPPPQTGAIIDRLREAADTIDRLTSTGEAVGYVSHHGLIELQCGFSASIVAPEAADEQFNRPLYTHASPREGHVEVPVEPIDAMTILAGIKQFGLAADGCDLRDLEAAIERLANQGETKP